MTEEIQVMAAWLATSGGEILLDLTVLAAGFTILSQLCRKCNQTPPWWRKVDLSTDLCWNLFPPLLYRLLAPCLLTFGIAVCYGRSETGDARQFFIDGHGPFAGIGVAWQIALYLLGGDLLLYLTHRLFHTGPLWRFHAVHHSSTEVEWISAARFHPVDRVIHGILPDIALLLLGIPPQVLVWLAPFIVATSALAHANLDWQLGPFRYVLVSPVYHRWHHSAQGEHVRTNYAATFPIFDLLFGTYCMPGNERPSAYGVGTGQLPRSFLAQLAYPFMRQRIGPVTAAIATQIDHEPTALI
jgi:sterol desaturase/sphingolipid hydroxylase (fatty acid hydroxylase superfamily)